MEPRADSAVRILHISDLHFKAEQDWDSDPVLAALLKDVERLVNGGLSPDLIAVTGDIAQSGKADDYGHAEKWMIRLLNITGRDANDLLLVPGNHDIDRDLAPPALETRRRSLQNLREGDLDKAITQTLSTAERRADFHVRIASFLRFRCNLGAAGGDLDTPWFPLSRDVRGVQVHLGMLDSAWMSPEPGEGIELDNGRLLVGRFQVEQVRDRTETADLSIALLHHPTAWLHAGERVGLRKRLMRVFGVLLQGHTHEADAEEIEKAIQNQFLEISAGACYQGSRYPGHYALLELDPFLGQARIHHRIWVSKELWVADSVHPNGIELRRLRQSPRSTGLTFHGSEGVSVTQVELEALQSLTNRTLQARHEQARALLEIAAEAGAIPVLEELREDLRPVMDSSRAGIDLRNLYHAATLNLARCQVNTDHADLAIGTLNGLDPTKLRPDHRISMVMLRALLGQPKDAREALPSEDTPRHDVALALIDLAEGRLPPRPIPEDVDLHLELSRWHHRRGDLAAASELALSLVAKKVDTQVDRMAATILLKSLWMSIFEVDAPHRSEVPLAIRKEVLRSIERVVNTALRTHPDDQRIIGLAAGYYVLCGELNQARRLREHMEMSQDSGTPPMAPWMEAVHEGMPLEGEGRQDEAFALLQETASCWPDRYPLEMGLARELLRRRRFQDGFDHAQRASVLLPTRLARLSLALALAGLGRWKEIPEDLDDVTSWGHWADPQSLERELRVQWLWLRAHVAEREERIRDATDLLEQVCLDANVGPEAFLRAASLHERLGDPQAAARWALSALDRDRASRGAGAAGLGAEALALAGQILALDRSQNHRARILGILKDLETRFPENPEALLARATLMDLVPAGKATAPETHRLLQRGVLFEVPIQDYKRFEAAAAEETEMVLQGHRLGLCDLETCWRDVELPAAVVFPMLGASNGAARRSLLLPVSLQENETPKLAGRHLILGVLELLLLQDLDLVEVLAGALGPTGSVVVFRDTRRRLEEEAATFGRQCRPGRLDLLERLENLLQSAARPVERRLGVTPVADNSDEDQAAEEGLVWVTARGTGPTGWSLHRLISSLDQVEALPRDRVAGLLSGAPLDPRAPILPGRIAMDQSALELLARWELLDPLLSATTLVLLPRTAASLVAERGQLQARCAAATRLQELLRFLARLEKEHRLVLLDRDEEAGRFGTRPASSEDDPHRLADRMTATLAYVGALLGDERRLLVTADGVIATLAEGRVPPIWQATSSWAPEALAHLDHALEGIAWRTSYMPQLIDALGLDEDRSAQADRGLLRWGIFDPRDPDAVVALGRRHLRVNKGEPDRVLRVLEDRTLWPGGHEDVGYRKVLGRAYGHAAFSWMSDPDLPEPDRIALVIGLLDRLDAIEIRQVGPLYALFHQLVSQTVHHPSDLLAPLWLAIDAWMGNSTRRRGPFLWAVRLDVYAAALVPESLADRKRLAEILALGLKPLDPLFPRRNDLLAFTSPVDEAAAVLFPVRGLPLLMGAVLESRENGAPPISVQLVRLLQGIATALNAPGPDSPLRPPCDGRFLTAVLSGIVDVPLPCRVPTAGLALTLEIGALQRSWPWLAHMQGPLDGRLATLLRRMAISDSRHEDRLRYAFVSLSAPYALVQDNPCALSILDLAAAQGDPPVPDWWALLEMLSEVPSKDGRPYTATLEVLLDDERADELPHRRAILDLFAEVPGASCSLVVVGLAPEGNVDARRVNLALRRLRLPEDQPAGRLGADLFVLLIAGALQPILLTADGPVDLTAELPRIVAALLQTPASPESPDHLDLAGLSQAPTSRRPKLADAEPAILRTCATVVDRLAMRKDGGPPSEEDRCWIIYRLYGWFLNSIGGQADWEHLIALAPADTGSSREGLLDPTHIGPDRLDLRMAVVLRSLVLPLLLAKTGHFPGLPESALEILQHPPVVSQAVVDALLALSARPVTEVERALRKAGDRADILGWGPYTTVPDLALAALTMLEPMALLRLPPLVRHAWLDDLLRRPGDRTGLLFPLCGVLIQGMGTLNPLEHDLLIDAVQAESSPLPSQFRLLLRVGLVTQAGHSELVREVEDALLATRMDEDCDDARVLWLLHLAERGGDQLTVMLRRLQEGPEAIPPQRVVRLLGPVVGRAAVGAGAARHLLEEVLRDPALQSDSEADHLRAMLGL